MSSTAPLRAQAKLNRHDHTLVTLMLRLATSNYARTWILASEDVFASVFAILRPRVVFPRALEEVIENLSGDAGKATLNTLAFEQWRKSEQAPFAGDVSMAYMEAFFLGLQVHPTVLKDPMLWTSALADLADLHGDVPTDGLGDTPRLDDPEVRLPTQTNALFHLNIQLLNVLTRWSATEQFIVELAFLLTHDMGLRLFFDLAQRRRRRWTAMLEAMLDENEEAVWELTAPSGALAKSGIVTVDPATRRVFPMGEFWHQWFSTCFPTVGSMFAKLVRPLTKRPNAGALGRVHPDDRAIILDLFHREGGAGRNVLLYGPRSIDKLGLVKDMLDATHLDSFTLHPDIPESDLAAVAYVAQAYVAQTCPSGVLVIPAADAVLTRTRRGMKSFAFFDIEMDDEVTDHEADDALLTHNQAKTVWLVHGVDRLSEDNLGRFLYVAPVKPASRAERRLEIETLLAPVHVRPEFHQELSQHLRLSEQQLRSAVRLVEDLGQTQDEQSWVPLGVDHGSVGYREALLRRVIEQSQRAMARQDREHLRQPVTTYSLDLLNLAGHFSVEQIIHSLKIRPSSTLCFYGLPGTGKTQLAEYIAVQLDRPIVMKRASDLINKYIGESEKAIQKMFQEAAEEDAVLFLDEADSFLMDRTRAVHSWETSQVNELLQCMERFRGVFICATNLFERVDRAAMRRFTFKLEFLDLTLEQRWTMFCTEAGIREEEVAPEQVEAWKNELLFTPLLTPGDFATIQRQCQLLGQRLTPEQWLKALAQEAKVKKDLLAQQRAQTGREGPLVAIS